MRLLLFISALICALLVEANLQFAASQSWKNVVTGVPFLLSWTGNNGSISITLQNGTASNPVNVNVIETAVTSNANYWTPGRFAIVGKTFFIGIEDEGGDKAVGDSFVVHAASSSTTSTKATSATATTATTSSVPTTTSSSLATTATAAAPTTSAPAAASSSGGLSSGAKIGLGVGIALGVVLIAAVAAFFAIRRRKRSSGTGIAMENTGAHINGYTDVKDGHKPVEMAVQPPELDSERPAPRHELA